MDVQIRTITPEAAQTMLDGNAANQRKRDDVRVRRYAAEMTAGKWNPVAGQAIMVADNGDLINGQHRLSAVVLAGVPVQMLVAYGVDPSTFWLVDQVEGGRTFSQKLTMAGVASGSHVASAATYALATEAAMSNGRSFDMRSREICEADKLAYIDAHPGLERWVTFAHNLLSKTMTSGIPAGMVAGWAVNAEAALADPGDRVVLQEYIERLYTLDMVPSNGTVASTRRAIQRYAPSGQERGKKVAAINRGWSHYAAGREVSRIEIGDCSLTAVTKVTR